MSILIKLSSDSKISLARILANWVFPTPVWPRNMKEPIGFSTILRPALFLWIALTTFSIAFFWPISLFPIMSFNLDSLLFSLLKILLTGTPLIIDTTSAMWDSSTLILFNFDCSSHSFWADIRSLSIRFSSSLNLAASSYFCFLTTEFFKTMMFSRSFSNLIIFWGTFILLIWTLDPASSRASIALSGRNLSVTYLLVKSTHAFKASSV